jgi:hypothetical protein
MSAYNFLYDDDSSENTHPSCTGTRKKHPRTTFAHQEMGKGVVIEKRSIPRCNHRKETLTPNFDPLDPLPYSGSEMAQIPVQLTLGELHN